MSKFHFILLIFLSIDSTSQTKNIQVKDDGFLFTYKDQSYIISGDSLYNNPTGSSWIGHKHNLIINDLVFFQDKNNGYLMHNSGGITYKFDGTNFSRIDDSFEFNTQYQSFPFLYKGGIHNFGGYGLFSFKNIITYFNEAKKETELVQVKTPLSENPTGRKKVFAQLDGNKLYMGSGFGYNTEIENGNRQSQIINDYWVFDFTNKEWKKLGESNPYMKDDTYHLIYDFNGKTLVITNENIFAVDIKNNKVEFYDNANSDLIKSNKKTGTRFLITYNKSKNGFYMVLNKTNFKNKLVFISTKDFIGLPTRAERLYTLSDNSNYYYLFGGLLIGIMGIILITKKKNNFQKISLKRKEIDLILNEEENQIFNLILERYPNYIPFPELMDVFESHLSYESRKKKLRHSLNQIEDKINGTLKSKNKIFEERKNKEDLRIKEIKII
jgi:hypothetical protein